MFVMLSALLQYNHIINFYDRTMSELWTLKAEIKGVCQCVCIVRRALHVALECIYAIIVWLMFTLSLPPVLAFFLFYSLELAHCQSHISKCSELSSLEMRFFSLFNSFCIVLPHCHVM